METPENPSGRSISILEDPSQPTYLNQDNPLLLWLPHIDIYVDELLRLEGLGDSSTQLVCAGMDSEAFIGHPNPEPSLRCRDCVDVRLYCTKCIVNTHKTQPFHRIQVSNLTEL